MFSVSLLVYQSNMTCDMRLTNHIGNFSFIHTEKHTSVSTYLTRQIMYHSCHLRHFDSDKIGACI